MTENTVLVESDAALHIIIHIYRFVCVTEHSTHTTSCPEFKHTDAQFMKSRPIFCLLHFRPGQIAAAATAAGVDFGSDD